jgi:hypothetical protein
MPRPSEEELVKEIEAMGFHTLPVKDQGGHALVVLWTECGDNSAVEHTGYMDPRLLAFEEKYDAFWEWINPGAIALCPNDFGESDNG